MNTALLVRGGACLVLGFCPVQPIFAAEPGINDTTQLSPAPLAPTTVSDRLKAKLNRKTIEPVSGPRTIPVANPGFETVDAKPASGWFLSQHAGPISYEITRQHQGCAEGDGCVRLLRTLPQVYGMIHQTIDGRTLVPGQILELTAHLRSEGVGPQGWRLFMNFNGRRPGARASGQLEQALSDTLTGDTDWQRMVVRSRIPEGTNQVAFGATLIDEGAGWLDEVSLRVTLE